MKIAKEYQETLDVIKQMGSPTRQEVADKMGLKLPCITNRTYRLVKLGYIRKVRVGSSHRVEAREITEPPMSIINRAFGMCRSASAAQSN